MALITRSRVVPASREEVWEIVADAHALPRWWPGVTRVEGVEETGFTEVHYSRRGRPVRFDQRYTEVDPPESLAWEMVLANSQLERLLTVWETRLRIVRAERGRAMVAIEELQIFRGAFRTGGFLQRRASVRRLDDALSGLSGLF